eukprot:808159-Prymnesium_polylepis.1
MAMATRLGMAASRERGVGESEAGSDEAGALRKPARRPAVRAPACRFSRARSTSCSCACCSCGIPISMNGPPLPGLPRKSRRFPPDPQPGPQQKHTH